MKSSQLLLSIVVLVVVSLTSAEGLSLSLSYPVSGNPTVIRLTCKNSEGTAATATFQRNGEEITDQVSVIINSMGVLVFTFSPNQELGGRFTCTDNGITSNTVTLPGELYRMRKCIRGREKVIGREGEGEGGREGGRDGGREGGKWYLLVESNSYGSGVIMISSETILLMSVPPGAILINELTDQTVKGGSTVEFVCEAIASDYQPEIVWMFGSKVYTDCSEDSRYCVQSNEFKSARLTRSKFVIKTEEKSSIHLITCYVTREQRVRDTATLKIIVNTGI